MKQCPICQSKAFDDAAICYGCLHEFTDDDCVPAVAPDLGQSDASANDGLPSFVIKIRPERERSGLTSWTCTVDLVPA